MKLDLSRKVRTYSTGMKQKLALAQAFADPVEILILDEPTSALDPSARQDVLDLVAEARSAGQTVIFSGHVLSEVEQVADRVAIMRLGQLMHVEDMHTRRGLRMILLRFADGPAGRLPRRAGADRPRARTARPCCWSTAGDVGRLHGLAEHAGRRRDRDRDRGPAEPLRPLPRPRRRGRTRTGCRHERHRHLDAEAPARIALDARPLVGGVLRALGADGLAGRSGSSTWWRPARSARRRGGTGSCRVLGGANMDYSTTALEVCWWNHPVDRPDRPRRGR